MKQMFVVTLSLLLFLGANGTVSSQWVETNWPNTCTPFCFAADGDNVFVGSRPNGGVSVSTDGGTTWNITKNGLTGESAGYIYSFARIGSNIFCETGDGIFLTVDTGKHWSSVRDGGGLLAVNGSTVYVAASKGVYLSNDLGKTWIPRSQDSGLGFYAICPLGLKLFASTGKGMVLSIDSGLTWHNINTGIPSHVTGITSIGSRILVSTFLKNGTAVYTTDNFGATWVPSTSGLPQEQANAITCVSNFIVVGFNNGTVFVSADSGGHWSKANEGLTSSSVMAFGATDKNLFIGTYVKGVWSRPLSEFTTSDVKSAQSIPYAIQCYPNPTTGILTLSNLPPNTKRIELINSLGEMVKTISPELLQSQIDISQLSAGLYVAKVITDRGVELAKIAKD